jgi:hypothetical protein
VSRRNGWRISQREDVVQQILGFGRNGRLGVAWLQLKVQSKERDARAMIGTKVVII